MKLYKINANIQNIKIKKLCCDCCYILHFQLSLFNINSNKERRIIMDALRIDAELLRQAEQKAQKQKVNLNQW